MKDAGYVVILSLGAIALLRFIVRDLRADYLTMLRPQLDDAEAAAIVATWTIIAEPQVELTRIGGRWPDRQHPLITDPADYEPILRNPLAHPIQGCDLPPALPAGWLPWWQRGAAVTELGHADHAAPGLAEGLLTYPGRHELTPLPRPPRPAEYREAVAA